MYICVCKAVTDSQIREAVNNGAQSMRAVREQLGVMTGCGKCACLTRDVVNSALADEEGVSAVFYQIA